LQDGKKKIIGIALAVLIFLVYCSVVTYPEDMDLYDLLITYPLGLAMVLLIAWQLFKLSQNPTFPLYEEVYGCMAGCLFVVFGVLFVVWVLWLLLKLISKLVGQ
jgi:hypothetical protein